MKKKCEGFYIGVDDDKCLVDTRVFVYRRTWVFVPMKCLKKIFIMLYYSHYC